MKIMTPIEIAPAEVVAFPPDVYPPYDAQADNNEGERVIFQDVIYESQTDNNPTNPLSGLNSSPIHWIVIGPSNRTAPFDDSLSTAAVLEGGNDLILRFQPSQAFTSLFLDGVIGSEITIEFFDPQNVLIQIETPQMISFQSHNSYWSYFFTPWEVSTRFQIDNLPVNLGGQVQITIKAGAGNRAAIANVAVGNPVIIGSTTQQNKLSILDFSTYERNAFGETEIIARRKAPVREFTVFVEENKKLTAERELMAASSRRIVLIPSPNVPDLTVYGILKSFDIDRVDRWNRSSATREGHALATLEIEGLT